VPSSIVRDIIGANGSGLKELSREFNCRVFIDKGEQADGTRLLHIIAFKDYGEKEVNQCRDAVLQLVNRLVATEQDALQDQPPLQGDGDDEVANSKPSKGDA
jgi:hypothetical protein